MDPQHSETSHRQGPEYRWEDIPPHAPQAVRDALAAAEASPGPDGAEPVRVLRAGTATPWPQHGTLVLEDGASLPVDGSLPPDLPLGYHDFHSDHGRWQTRVIVTPDQCLLPGGRQWGWTVQLHSLRSGRSWGIGDLDDLRRLAEWSAGLGAGLLLVNPLCAPSPVLPQNASPYYPTSRRFRNPLYLCIEEVPAAERLGAELTPLAAAGRALGAQRRLDRDVVFRLKQEALRAIWSALPPDAAFDRFCRQQGNSLEQFATYCVLAEQYGEDWRRWPVELRRPDGHQVREFAAEHAGEVRYHQWLQWLLDEQLARASHGLSLVQDLPIGMDPGGADAWAWQDLLAQGISIGAPPDAFNPDGQNWALPPFVPRKLRAAGYRPFIETIRATLRHAGGLRIDHVMGLFRLWWIPEGQEPSQGCYVRYPADDLLGILMLESHRAGAFVVGEDLGTVEPGVRQRLARHHILSCRLLWFEPTPPANYPQLAMAAVTTHDLPTIAGLWTGSDLAAQAALGWSRNDEMCRLRQHLGEMLGVAQNAPVEEVIEKAYALLAEAPSLLLTATLEDAQAVQERPNMPGTITEWPNWSLALPQTLETLETAELPRRIARSLAGPMGP